MIIIIIIIIDNIIKHIIMYKWSYKKNWIVLRVKFHFKNIIYIILNEQRETIYMNPWMSRKWKDLNKINGGENDDMKCLKSLKI
jgi:hypothetical protein